MKIFFEHISATGNDFLIADNRHNQIISCDTITRKAKEYIQLNKIDGLILLESANKFNFKMIYYNRDGQEVELCGNGLRAISWFAARCLNISRMNNIYKIETMNGHYESSINLDEIKIKMGRPSQVNSIQVDDLIQARESLYLYTGVPHCVFYMDNIEQIDIKEISTRIRHDGRFINGTNVNYFEKKSNGDLMMRTYERGVEDETLSCGTGACAVAFLATKLWQNEKWNIQTKGGVLKMQVNKSNISLVGSVKHLGQITFEI